MLQELAKDPNMFFTRKFDPKISHRIIDLVDQHLLGRSGPVSSYYWENAYSAKDKKADPSALTYFMAFARQARQRLLLGRICRPALTSLDNVDQVMHNDSFAGYLLHITLASDPGQPGIEARALLAPQHVVMVNASAAGKASARFVDMEVGPLWDPKDNVFARYPHNSKGEKKERREKE